MNSHFNVIRSGLIVILWAAVLACQAAAGATIYVDDSAAGLDDGGSWQNAYRYLQDALAVAANGDEIRVGQGTYKPDQGGEQTPGDRSAAFQLVNGVTLRGGYAGVGAVDPNVHDVALYETILSGDLNGDDGPDLPTWAENNYHVVTTGMGAGPTTILQGFTISGGNANGSTPNSQGSGMYNDQSSPLVIHCTFTFNRANNIGGGMVNIQSSPTVTNCTFFGNYAFNGGGGICNEQSSPTVAHCIFLGNGADFGGGMYNCTDSDPNVTNCLFHFNIVDYYGGGMLNLDNCNPTVAHCTFSYNSADYGGGIYNHTNSDPNLSTCILWSNSAYIAGSQICNYDGTSSALVAYSDVQGGWPGKGNIDQDPLFIDADGPDDISCTEDDNLRLAHNSPCIDVGDNAAPTLPPADLVGNPRVVDGNGDGMAVVDMGAFEFQARVHNTTQDIWYEAIQPAIDDANGGDEIEVLPGTYIEAINFIGKAVRLYSSGGPEVTIIDGTGHYHVVQCVNSEGADTILKGFTITGGNANGPGLDDKYGGGLFNYEAGPTVTNCIFSGNVAVYNGGGMYNSNNSNPMVTNCTFSGNIAGDGGGMGNEGNINNSKSPAVVQCIFIGNMADYNGGGMDNFEASPTVTNCTFRGNTAQYGGGGMRNFESRSTVTNCTFSENSAENGGGMHGDSGSPTVTNSTFLGNTADWGGGMCNWYSSPTITGFPFAITDCTFSGNTADYGGSMYFYESDPNLINCTFSGNQASQGNALACDSWQHNYPNTVLMNNCILWDGGDEIWNNDSSTITINYSNIQGGYPGTGNIDENPQFKDAEGADNLVGTADDNLRLAYNSPCIDAGDSAVLLAVPILFDLDGNDRYTDIETIANTGVGPFEFVDMGAYEFYCSGLAGDLNCDGVVNLYDLCILANHWLHSNSTP